MSTLVQHEMLDAEVFPPGAGLDWYGAALPERQNVSHGKHHCARSKSTTTGLRLCADVKKAPSGAFVFSRGPALTIHKQTLLPAQWQ